MSRQGRTNDTYILPETYLNLDELAAPSAVSSRSDYERGETLEQDLSRSDANGSLQPYFSVERGDSAVLPAGERSPSTAGLAVLDHAEEPQAQPLDASRDYLDRQNRATSRLSHHRPSYHGHLTEIAAPAPVNNHTHVPDRSSLDKTSYEEPKTSELATRIYTISYLIFFSIWGTLARLGLQALTVYPGVPVTQGVLWANVAGSFIMGFLSEDRKLFQESWGTGPGKLTRLPSGERKKQHAALKKTIPLYIGLATGFCGCFTSFSSWQRDSFLALSNSAVTIGSSTSNVPLPRNGGYSFLALLATLILTPTLCIAALQVGAHFALACEPITPSFSFRATRKFLDPLMVALAALTWLGSVFLSIWPPDRPSGPSGYSFWAAETWRGDAIFACVFAPLGCLTRFYVSMALNARLPSFPLGTFTVNIFGSIMEAIFYDLQHSRLQAGTGGGIVGCQVLQGLMDGFCGSTTTISTWVAELKGLRRRHAYIYGAASTLVGLAFMIVIMGSLLWTRGFASTACGK